MYSENLEINKIMVSIEIEREWRQGKAQVEYTELLGDSPELLEAIVKPTILQLQADLKFLNLSCARLISKGERELKDVTVQMIFIEYVKFVWYEKTRFYNRQISKLKRLIPSEEREGEVTESMIQRAKEFSILDLINGARRAGRNYVALCPFHNEKTPSCHIYKEQNRFHCFGCQADGDPIDFLMKTHDIGFHDAVKRLQ